MPGRALLALAIGIVLSLAFFPVAAEAKPKCNGKKATIVGTKGDDKIKVKKKGRGKQVVVGRGGNDTIITGKGPDIVCGGPGDDSIFAGKGDDRAFGEDGNDMITNEKGNDTTEGGAGNDELHGGPSSDTIKGEGGDDLVDGGAKGDDLFGGSGNNVLVGGDGEDKMIGEAGADVMRGGSGSENMHGGAGGDRLYGEIQDDKMFGEGGDDLLVGSHGIDEMSGGAGDDWLRGGTNKDEYSGDAGVDTASFATQMPDQWFDGVEVNLSTGVAQGSGGTDTLGGIENVLGSAFDDQITGNSAPNLIDGSVGNDTLTASGGGDRAIGGPGVDSCSGFAQITTCGLGDGNPRPSQGFAYIDSRGPDPGITVMGQSGTQADDLLITPVPSRGGFRVTANGTSLIAYSGSYGGDCSNDGANAVFCPGPAAGLSFVTFWGDGGSDALRLADGFPATMTADVDGGTGSDLVAGSSGDDVLQSGQSGQDTLQGRAGSDALIAEGSGGDVLDGGNGNDDLATDDPCQGHDYIGGGGFDVASFARYLIAFNGRNGVTAQLSGTARDPSRAGCAPTRIRPDNEILEGSFGPDVLYGDAGGNPLIIGREGDDLIYGGDGGDKLRGDAGRDSFFGEGGFDTLEAQDGATDRVLDCGRGGGAALRDSQDPAGQDCKKPKKKKKGKKKRKRR